MSKEQWGHGRHTGLVEGVDIGAARGQVIGAHLLAQRVHALVEACVDAYVTDRTVDLLTLLQMIKEDVAKHLPEEDV